MDVQQLRIAGLFVLTPVVHKDDRGYFYESYNKTKLPAELQSIHFVQDNESFSQKGTIRGLHLQVDEAAQAKLVRVISGTVLDVAVDLRPQSPTFGQYESIILSDDNKKQFYIPRGFAHGFSVLSETALFSYKCDNYYSKNHEAGLRFDDPDLNINWQVSAADCKVSEKDLLLPYLQNLKKMWNK